MGRFLLGLVAGLVVGVLAMAYNPNLLQEVRAGLASLTGVVLRGTEEAAEKIGDAADEVAKGAREATDEDPVEKPSPPAGAFEGAEQPAPAAPGGDPTRTD